MSDLEFNKIAAGVLVAGLIAMVSGKAADVLYHPVKQPEKRGYAIEVVESAEAGEAEATGPVDILPLIASADAAAGEKAIKKCTACHSFDKGGKNMVGPNLWGIVGRAKGAHEGFVYSDAIKGLGGNWDYEALSGFLEKPAKYAAGTKMAFAGIKKPEDRASLIAYLRSLSDAPIALPAAASPAPAPAAPEAAATPPAAESAP